jgi:hypothetical protein
VWSSTTTSSPISDLSDRSVAPLARGSLNTFDASSSAPLAPTSAIRLPPLRVVTTSFAATFNSYMSGKCFFLQNRP